MNSKQYYENFLINIRQEYDTQRTAREDQLTAKEEMISFYEKEV